MESVLKCVQRGHCIGCGAVLVLLVVLGLFFAGLSFPFVLLLVICEAVEGQGALSSVMARRRLLVLVGRRL